MLPDKDKPPEDTNRRDGKGAGEEEELQRRTGGQGLDTRPSSGLAGTGKKVKNGRGGRGVVLGNGGGSMEPRREKPQGLTGMLATSREAKGKKKTREEAVEMGTRRGDAGAERDLGSRSRAARHQERGGRWRLAGVEACLCGQVIQERKRRGIIGYKKSGVSHSNGVRWGRKYTEGDRNRSRKQLKWWVRVS